MIVDVQSARTLECTAMRERAQVGKVVARFVVIVRVAAVDDLIGMRRDRVDLREACGWSRASLT